jgi:D-arabinose 1-dehydrogenase-like Zn-dependent alcohol dehydrogenase
MTNKGTPHVDAYAAREARASLGPHEVEIEITHCGICHSDLH